MGTVSKKLKRDKRSRVQAEDENRFDEDLKNAVSDEEEDSIAEYGDDASDDYDDQEEEEDEEDNEEEEEDEGYDVENDEEGDDGHEQNDCQKDEKMEELEREYKDLQDMEQNLIQNLKRHKDEDLLKGKAMRNQKALWDKNLEFRILLQKAFSKSNRLPQEPFRSSFCQFDEGVGVAYLDLITSCKKTIDSFLELQEALLESNPSIAQAAEGNSGLSLKHSGMSSNLDLENDKEWLKTSQMQARIATFRNKSVDKWHRKNEVSTGVAVKKGKLHAFNQNISDQVATYMRDPSKMIKSMQMRRETVGVFGSVPGLVDGTKKEGANADGDPELLDDTEFYQQLFKEFFETIDPNSSEAAFYAIKRLQTKKRKIVDRRASKSRKIRYNVHEKIVNFMAPQPMDLPSMAPKLFENLFGLRTSRSAS